ncbi:MAG: hypothetical protein IH897_07245, partial [Planctomycetes bacterium]|nr:hypothetical protein [Planctomycetota bacterium]
MKHVCRVVILGLMLSSFMAAVLSGCGGSDSDEGKTQGKPTSVDDAEDEFSEGK